MSHDSRRFAPYYPALYRRGTLLGVGLLGLGLLAGCQDKGADTFLEADSVQLGEGIQGELTSTSPINLKDGSRHGRHWVCSEQGTGHLYRLDASFDGSVSLFDESGRWLGEASHTTEQDAHVLLGGGPDCSLVVINGEEQNAFGPYELIPDTSEAHSSLTDGSSIIGAIGDEAERYSFTLDSAQQVSLRLAGAADAGLSLQGDDMMTRAEHCSDGGQRLETYLAAGDYEAVVTSGQAAHGPSSKGACAGGFVSDGDGYRLSLDFADLSSGLRNEGPLRDGDDINGDLASTSRSNQYTLSLDAPTQVRLIMNSSEFDTMLRVSGPDTSIEVDDTGMGSNADLSTVLRAGDYTVEATGYGSQTGHYRLITELSEFKGELQEGSIPMTPGEPIIGQAVNTRFTTYTLTVDQPAEVDIQASSSDFDTILSLEGDDTAVRDDDGGDGTNSRISTVLDPGEYEIQVSSYHGTSLGTFRLEANVVPFEGEMQNSGTLEPGSEVQGILNRTSNSYTFSLEEPSTVRIAMNSSSFDTLLRLQGEGINIENDDGGTDRNALLETVLEAGDYELTASSYDGSGRYSLSMEAEPFDGVMQSDGELHPGDTVHGMLNGNATLAYQLVIDEERAVKIETSSSAVDTVLSLVGNGISLSDDDGGTTHLGSLIETTLSPGRYDLSIAGYGSSGFVRIEVAN